MLGAASATFFFLIWWDVPHAYQRLVAPFISSPTSFLAFHVNRIKLLELFGLEDKLMYGKELPSQEGDFFQKNSSDQKILSDFCFWESA